MERFKSTLGTTAAIVFGLVLAAHMRHGGVEEPTRMARPAVAAVAPRTDPPTEAQNTSSPLQAFDTASAAVPVVASPMLLGAVVPVLPAEIAPPARRLRKTAAASKSKGANRTVRLRQASSGRQQPVERIATVSRDDVRAHDARPDPIGGLIRRLDDRYGS